MLKTDDCGRRRRRMARLAGAGLMLATATAATAQDVHRGGTAVMTLNHVPTSLLNQVATGAYDFAMGAKYLEPLVYVDENWEFTPKLATAWQVSPDGLTWTFTLRQGVKWHDGRDFVAADVKWNFENVWKKAWSSIFLDAVTAVDVIDDGSVRFTLSQPISQGVVLGTFAQRLFLVAPQGFVDTTLRESPQNLHPTGTGPFRVKEYVTGEYLVLERNPDYWDAGKPYLDQFIVRMIPDPNTRSSALQAGEVDLVPLGSLPLADTDLARTDPRFVVSDKGYDGYVWSWGLTFNMLKPPLDNLKVRQAIAHAVDKAKIAELIFLGYAKPQDGAFPAGVKYYTDDVARYAVDVAEANRLLDEAGFPRGADGERFALKFVGSGGQIGIFQRTGQYLAQALKELGITVTVEIPDFSTYLRQVYKDRDFDIELFNSVFVLDPCISTVGWYTSEAFLSGGYFRNHSGLQDPAVDAAVATGCASQDESVRMTALADFQKLTGESLSILPLVQEQRNNVYSARLKNVGEGSVNWFYGSWADMWVSE